ncbi:MAG TPA: hypothetical protein EYG67_03230 [Campylobacterales bacterium]|nr:hypothetical protein [Campylobacterales bacterium]
MIKRITTVSTLLGSLLMAEALEYKGNVSLESAYWSHDLEQKRESQMALHLEGEATYKIDENKKVVAKVKGIYDANDGKRRYFDFNDLYFQHSFENSNFLIGRNTRFWGAMEFYNHTDNFNTKDWADDPFDYESKLGAWNMAYTYYLDDAEISIIAKFYEEEQGVAESRSINNFMPSNYSSNLATQRDRSNPTLYLKYDASIEGKQIDYSIIYQNGYDEQRYLTPVNSLDVNSSLQQRAYLVDKVMGYATWVNGSTIYKTELAYTYSGTSLVADYAQGSLGVEHTLYGMWKKMDLGLLAEYYKYKTFEKRKLNAKDFGKIFDDDLALGFRLSLNDIQSSEVLGGVDIDRHNSEKIYFVEYETRLQDKYKLGVKVQHLAPKKDSLFHDIDTVMVELGYHF